MSARRTASGALLCLLALISARPAAADVSLVQIVQAQAGPQAKGELAKSLIEVSRSRMRLVTAVARKTGDKPDDNAEPWRLVQVLDLATTSLWVIDPDSRSYRRKPLAALVDGPALDARPAVFDVVGSSVVVTPGTLVRRCLGADCAHFHVTAELSLRGRRTGETKARLEQDIWMAPLTGDTQKGLLDVIAFEAAFRRQARTELSPLDRQTYRVREAAEVLGVPSRQLEDALAKVRRALTDVAGYPLSSAVAWYSDGPAGEAAPRVEAAVPPAPKQEPQLLQNPPPQPPAPPRRLFARRDWQAPWRRVNSALARAQAGFPRLPPLRIHQQPGSQPPPVLQSYEAFQAEMAAAIERLDRDREAGAQGPREAGAQGPREAAPPEPQPERGSLTHEPPPAAPEPAAGRNLRVYESFSEIGELVPVSGIPDEHFRPPIGFKRK